MLWSVEGTLSESGIQGINADVGHCHCCGFYEIFLGDFASEAIKQGRNHSYHALWRFIANTENDCGNGVSNGLCEF